MARVSYNSLTTQDANTYKVGFFSLKDGESAIVRFNYRTAEDFEIYTTHPIRIGNAAFNNRRVSCLKEGPYDMVHRCPLCEHGGEFSKVQDRIYIQMLQYVSENGRIVPKAVVWERPVNPFAATLKSYLDNYGPLTEIICKIERTGSGLDTKYNIIPNLNPQMYTEEVYPKVFTDFDGYSVLGTQLMDKTAEEIEEYLATGNFPMPNRTAVNVANTSQNNNYPHNATPVDDVPWKSPVLDEEDNPFTNPDLAMPYNPVTPPSTTPVMGRPQRYY